MLIAATLLRKNLLRAHPGSARRARPARLARRGDQPLPRRCRRARRAMIDTWIDLIGATVFAVVALAIMLAINPPITLAVFVPLLGVVVAGQRWLTARIEHYRRRQPRGDRRSPASSASCSARCRRSRSPAPRARRHATSARSTTRAATPRARTGCSTSCSTRSTPTRSTSAPASILLLAAAVDARGQLHGRRLRAVRLATWAGMTELPRCSGVMLARYKQAGVSFERMSDAAATARRRERWSQHGPIYLHGALPAGAARAAQPPADRLQHARGARA